MASAAVYGELYAQLPRPPSEYPPMEERPYPERFTNDFFRDCLPELEYQLEEAVVAGDVEKVHELISKGADKDAKLNEKGMTALMIACELGWFHMVKYLVEVEEVNMDLMARNGLRAICYAGKEQFRWPNENEIADYLKSKGSQYTWWGACFSGDIKRIEVYLENGQDINEVNPVLWNYNAIDCAVYGGCAMCAHFLAARGALIMVRNCHVPITEDMLYSIGRGDAYMYKEWGVEEGPWVKF
eukprot:gnl/TRDRNA2_/TRDRNA2_177600_c1_seq1.p1 gnl/TRDRNA2_/TRDRNA2_177600_c1~~gnl/TRDRNA2_/TRDRNA2_177600_c1_seq1.p1  ORF type:complete len:259 (-),score=72.03 gnl/TRDRNA2_/TRDRNA2_177600_c1_seq1:77-802(-)